jgi:addiction module RelE/StbE family toxin
MYKLDFLPIAKRDLKQIVDYISVNLEAPQAAMDFLDTVDATVDCLAVNPFAGHPYRPVNPIATEYRDKKVKNYLLFYVVLENTIEIHRLVYAKRDLPKIIR